MFCDWVSSLGKIRDTFLLFFTLLFFKDFFDRESEFPSFIIPCRPFPLLIRTILSTIKSFYC